MGDRDVREAGATRESIMPNLRYRWRDGDVRKAGALREGIIPNLCHRWGDGDVCKAGALREGISSNLCHRWGDRDAREVGAILESPLLYLRFPLRYDDLAILDVVAVFFVFFHDSIFFRFCGRFGEESE